MAVKLPLYPSGKNIQGAAENGTAKNIWILRRISNRSEDKIP
jgi:hypothetical protein